MSKINHIDFSEVGVDVNTLEELHELCLTYSALDIPFAEGFTEDSADAIRDDLTGWFIQCTDGTIETKLTEDGLAISIINYPIKYSMGSLDFAIACQLLMSNQEAELKVHLAQHCKEYK